MWANNNSDARIGDIVFLAEIHRQGCKPYMAARSTPCHTNGSLKPSIDGWMGETNNVSSYARGVGVVTRVTGELFDRVLVRRMSQADAELALEEWMRTNKGSV